ncbi:ATP-binding protein [Phocaeicola sartorii]|uniref:ATP-binding protein n=1 Tax=Phocaeicola sartorii TaxID=671267 RepID=UPI0025905018|nr:ATP-binding protein [Phocaeicola sartorii]
MKKLKFPERSSVEFKECRGKRSATLPDDLWESIAAFSNTHGGMVYLGVNDDGEIIGLDNKDLDKLQKDLSTLIKGKFNIQPKVEVLCNNGYIQVQVSELEVYNKPIYCKKIGPRKIYVRQGSTNVLASDEEMRSLFAGASGGGENQTVEGLPAELVDEDKLDDYMSHTGLKNITFYSLDEKLKKLKALRDSKLTIFGLIAFGKDSAIDDTLNNIYIDFKMFPGTSKVSAEGLDIIYRDRTEFHGDIAKQFTQAFEYIKSKLPKEAIVNKETGLREERYILPEEALREALANAVAHRDYLLQGSCVNVDLYSDRIELSNPGESLIAIADLEKASSKARNPSLIEFLKAYKITDKTARGIPTIYQAARNRGLLDPKFENISGDFKATLYFSSPHSGKDKEWVDEIASDFNLKDTQKNALVHVKHNGTISNKEYCEINHMNSRNDDRKALRELGELLEKGLFMKEGAGAGTKYRLAQ